MEFKKIHAKRVLTPVGWLDNAIISINGDRIIDINTSDKPCSNDINVLPALIDTHIHGAMGADTMDATHKSLNTISCFLAQHGVGAFLATTVTESHEKIESALQQVKNSMKQGLAGATLLGSYLEGPFFNAIHKGAHSKELLHAPDYQLIKKWLTLAEGTLKCIALAPEYPESLTIIKWLRTKNIRVMLGHSNADYQTTKDALLAGASGIVHCYNGMSGLHHRNPGIVGAALTIDNCQTEIIVDGHHVHPAAIKIAHQCCGKNLLLITDAMRATGMQNGDYQLGKLLVHMQDNIVRTDDGGLAGSTLTLDRAVNNFAKFAHIDFEQAWLHGSYYPAKALGIDNELGSIAPNKRANLVLLNKQNHIIATIVNGNVVYQSMEFKKQYLSNE
ncbi:MULTISPECIES: N-acetylglucosamine-6-phosphate deacetylase [unclassified Gilliamella]|uniref:N-acetylglucosamine-6-phosphate deacetylase n=1 Tax=unclassified Gilliamella TaxID=2685620 RepID=UPI001320BB9B|nr:MULTISPECIES: N-acetylglucosamine-6-phosphate deacetylase [unclassified Gilliamella]MWN32051.1 N-acetylglucosamine-6-phosphate deacetylase [Gilliamella sp. Pra-s60]MWP29310.1 N-acetylglucosamine-6-phosphate deacetylase [Gilliamella sp. Pra-s54]